MNGLQRRMILYGDTLILEGVRTNLKNHPELEIIVLDQPLEEPLNVLGSYCPAVLIFDMGAIQPDSLLSLLQKPDLLLIGIDPETHQALVWSGRQASAVEAADLIDVIRTDFLQKEEYGKNEAIRRPCQSPTVSIPVDQTARQVTSKPGRNR